MHVYKLASTILKYFFRRFMSEDYCNQCINRSIKHFEEFIKSIKELITKISVDDLIHKGGLNPYMTALLRIESLREVAALFVYKRFERSLGTSFGTVIEKFLTDCLSGVRGKDLNECKGRRREWICWWDIILHNPPGFQLPTKQHISNCTCEACQLLTSEKREVKVVLSVKSGPADVNKDIVMEFIRNAKTACKNGYIPYLGLTYGKTAFQIAVTTMRDNSVLQLDPSEHLLVGRALFRKFLGVDCYDSLISRLRNIGGVDIFSLIEKKIELIEHELGKRYKNIDDILRDIS
jgi:hypothetical protein